MISYLSRDEMESVLRVMTDRLWWSESILKQGAFSGLTLKDNEKQDLTISCPTLSQEELESLLVVILDGIFLLN